ncbi:sulfatase-like hydrolase/transferase [Sulfurospirillum barnesii]|uniref:Phosphoglycerol transferase family protein, alkaline phosphatase superfamily n=1 Tax=Sulfurospirillum barnesii (strain ATCC 700032 / DSM 10660 / SES-3) TaxID=760154 RepID=I3XY04_SULBS|nr:sulfatase-like hydrolase/transferase [Sulfurospirillum barnesii]AFL68828.1 phosphoglycerol transferase family protein, alkaline phosphatase superfamily [Sulfurospirillum barnesii SES-3]
MYILLWISAGFFILSLLTCKNYTQNNRRAFLGAFVVFIYLVLSIFYIISDYFTGEGINDAVIFHLLYGLDGSGYGDYYMIITFGVVLFIASLIFSLGYYRLAKKAFGISGNKFKRIFSLIFLFSAFLLHPSVHFFGQTTLKIFGFEDALSREHHFLDYYQEPTLTPIHEEHPNLVYIFAESLEETYFDEKLFPSLMTKLRPIREQSTLFTEIKQAQGTSWTIAGMTSVLCGLPLVTPSTGKHSPQGNSMSKMSTFYSGAVCMSDMLHKEGYKMVYRSGSSLEFAGVDKLYRTHKFEDIKGINELKSRLKDKRYQTPWGLYDDTLFDLSMSDFLRLSKSKQKFALFISTMDTHHPHGHVSKGCKANRYKEGDNSMLNAVACADELIAHFIEQIQKSPYGNNTIIVVGSDHLAMHNMAIDDLMKGKRRNQFIVIDPRQSHGKKVEKVGTTLDIGATILPFLGYEADLGLGRNLLKEEPSLAEKFSNFDALLSAWSKEISHFWEFPKIEQDLVLDSAKKQLKIGSSFYKFPILLRLNETLEVNPFFEVKIKFFETTKLFGYLHDFSDDDPFVWVDECSRIGTLESMKNIPSKSSYCYAYGTLGGEISTGILSSSKSLSLDTLNELVSLPFDTEEAKRRRENLSKLHK